jgi:hypothetical protein
MQLLVNFFVQLDVLPQKLIAISMNTLQLELLELKLAILVSFIKELVQLLLVLELVII